MTKSDISVLQVSKFYSPVIGGIEYVVEKIAKELNDQLYIQTLVCGNDENSNEEIFEEEVMVHRSTVIGTIASMPISLNFIKNFKMFSQEKDIVLIHMPFPLADLACLLSGYRGKVIVWWHSDIVRQKKLLHLYKPLMKWLLNRADKIIVATMGLVDGSKYLPSYRDKCVLIPYGVDREFFVEGDYFKSKVKQKKSTLDILFIGRLVYYKGCDILLEAFSLLQNTNCKLSVLGKGPLLESLKKNSLSLGINDRVSFCSEPTRKGIMRSIAKCDIFVLPSVARSEAFGIVQIEAMAFGKPVINTNLKSGVPHVSVDGETGITVPPNDAIALAKAIDRLSSNPALRKTYGENARRYVEEKYYPDSMTDKLFELVKEIML